MAAIRSVTWVGMAWPMVSQTTMSSAPSVRGSAAMPITRSGSVSALERAGERRGDAQLDRAADLAGDLDGVGHRRDAVLGGAPDVGLVVRVRRGEAVLEVARARGGGLLDVPRRGDPDPAPVELVGCQRGDDVERVGKRRDEVRPGHRADLERGDAERQQLADDLDLAFGGQQLGGQLEAVAQGDVAQLGARRVGRGVMPRAPISSSLEAQDRSTAPRAVCSPRSGPTLRIGSDAPPITGTMPGKPTDLWLGLAGVNVEVLDHVSRGVLLVGADVGGGVDRPGRHAGLVEDLQRLVAVVLDRSTARSPRRVRRGAASGPRWSAGPDRRPRSGRPMVCM